MANPTPHAERPHVRVYKAKLPPALGLVVLLPLLLVSASLAAALLVGGGITAMVLPMFMRRREAKPPADGKTIELSADDYHEIDDRRRP